MLEEKPVAELMGPRAEQGFGLACCVPPPPSLAPPPPRPDTAATDAGAADGKSAAASAAATPAPGAAPKGKGGAAAPAPPSGGGGGGAAPAASQEAPSEPAMSEAQRALIKAALDAMGANSTTPVLVPVKLHVPAGQVVSYPACVFRDTYLLAGGDVVDKVGGGAVAGRGGTGRGGGGGQEGVSGFVGRVFCGSLPWVKKATCNQIISGASGPPLCELRTATSTWVPQYSG